MRLRIGILKPALKWSFASPIPEGGSKTAFGIFFFALSRILKKQGKRRKTKKTRENLGFFDRHLLRPETLGGATRI